MFKGKGSGIRNEKKTIYLSLVQNNMQKKISVKKKQNVYVKTYIA